MSGNAFLFFGILIFIFILWVMTGGPAKPISFSGPYLHPIDGPGETAEPYSLGRGWSPLGSGSSSGVGLSTLEEQIDDLSSFGEPSEYRGLVTLNRNPSGPRNTSANKEYVSIDVSRRAGDPIVLTGWRLESAASKIGAVIPGGVEIPRSGSVNPSIAITLAPGESAVITSGRSPIGTSFRESLCTGYLGEFQSFSPELSQMCPSPQQEFKHRYADQGDSECSSYTWQLPRCSVISDAPSELSNECEDFLDELNYNSCVAEYRDVEGFAQDTWRIFIGASKELWRESHETIRLIDASGKTVDVLAY